LITWREWYVVLVFDTSDPMKSSYGIICFVFYILFCKVLEMMQSDMIHTASCTYIHVLSLCHLYPFTSYLKNTNENFQKILFLCFLLTTLHLRREMN
jgi:hypothetical protein